MAAATQSVRDDIVQIFEGLLTPMEAKDLEVGVYNNTIDYAGAHKIPLSWSCDLFREIYLSKARNIFANLNNDTYIKNHMLIERLKHGEFAPHDLASMTRESLFPEKWQDIQEAEERILQSAYEITQTSMSDQIICGKCKNNKVSYYEQQTRSGDEAMTTFYTCLVCNHKWKH